MQLSLLLFAFIGCVTPGPNNLMVMTSGANFGYRRTIPHMLGIASGFSVMIILVGLGLMVVIERYPFIKLLLVVLCTVYLFWLAWKIATTVSINKGESRAKPMNFWQAAAFQWVNPKAWGMALSAITLYAPDKTFITIALVALSYFIVCFPCNSLWAGLGTTIHRWISEPMRLRVFNIVMAMLLLLSYVPILLTLNEI